MAYLDHNATSPLRPEARLAMERALCAQANASSVHRYGRGARASIEDAREEIARLVNARPEDVIFTSGGTEANSLALHGAVEGADERGACVERLFVSAIEHDSVLATAVAIADHSPGLLSSQIPVTPEGVVDLAALERMLNQSRGRVLVAVMAANNETGVIQPVSDVIELVRKADGLVLVDAVQACGKIPVDFAARGADYLTLSAHKLGGPQGVGALVIKEAAPFGAQIRGGGQERKRRAGTENVAGIAGFGAAAKAARGDDLSRLEKMRDLFESGLRQRFADAVVFGENAPRLAGTSNFAVPGISAETAVISLDLDGVMVSSGSACSSGKVTPSHVLKAMGAPERLLRSALRVSLGWNSEEADLALVVDSLAKLAARASARRAA
jgi:cysteine desulfurase